MRKLALSFVRVSAAITVLVLAGGAVIVQPVLGSHELTGTERALRGAGMRAWSFTGPRQALDASDQRSYWRAGIPAVLVTDTAFLRNPNYHTRNDTAGTLDYVRMARVVDGVFSAVIHPSKEAHV